MPFNTSYAQHLQGLGVVGFDFSLCKARVYAQHCGDIFMVKVLPEALLRSWQVNVNLHRGDDAELKQNGT